MEIEEHVEDLRCFVPSNDFAVSREFYATVGFREMWSDAKIALLQLGRCSFFLQDYFVKEWAENVMLDLRVLDADTFFTHLQSLNLVDRFRGVRIAPPEDDSHKGIRSGHFIDPSGVLWHFSQTLKSR